MKEISDVFDKMLSFESLERAYRNARCQKRYRPEVLEFSSNVDKNLHEIQQEMRTGTFRFGPYRKHWVYIPKKRVVMALPFKSRIIQWAVYQELMPFYDKLMIEDSYACRVNGGTLRAAKKLQYWMRYCERNSQHNWYIIKLDISKFFYRVNHETLKKILWKRVTDENLRHLLTLIIDSDECFGLPRGKSAEEIADDEWLNDVGMPIGNLTSQLFANIYLNELDHYCKHILHIHRYIRYMDDVVAIAESKEQARNYLACMKDFLINELQLDVNKKTRIQPLKPLEFVGYIVNGSYIKIRKPTVRRLKRAFKEICREYFAGTMSKEDFTRRVASYSGLMLHCRNQQLKDRLNAIYLAEKKKRV